MAKTLLSIEDLRWRALAEIRKQPGCSDVRASQSIASRISKLRIIGPYVWSPLALLMPTPRLAPRSMSKASCAAIMI